MECLKKIGNAPESASERRVILSMETEAVSRNVFRLIKGEGKENEKNIAFQTHRMALEFSKSVEEKVPDFLCDEFRVELEEQIKLGQGYQLPNFLSDIIFRRHIFEVFLEGNIPSRTQTLIENVGELMKRILGKEISMRDGFHAYPCLISTLIEKAEKVVNDACERASTIIAAIFEAERAQLFTINL